VDLKFVLGCRKIPQLFNLCFETKMATILNNYWILAPLLVWIFVWKGLALWKSARRGEKIWFVALLLLNTLGLLEIIYIFIVAKKKEGAIGPDGGTENMMRKKIV